MEKFSTKNNFFQEQETSALKEKIVTLQGEIKKLQDQCKQERQEKNKFY